MTMKSIFINIFTVTLFLTGIMLLYLIASRNQYVKPNITRRFLIKSTCPSSDFRGTDQKVVAYSFYGKINSKYFKGIPINAEMVSKLYPGWTMRLYHNIDPSDSESRDQLKRIMNEHPNLDECYVGNISQDDFPHIEKKHGSVWRFLAMGDESVDIFLCRDLDCVPSQREVDAVNEWLNSSFTFHIMRDSSWHLPFILAGLWGGKNEDMEKMHNLTRELVNASKSQMKGIDQALLQKYVWPMAKEDSIAHDSYYCKYFPNTKPWPTQRVNLTFVGSSRLIPRTHSKCPVECRPPAHKNWEYC